MSIFKRGSTYWFHFLFSDEHIQKSTKQGNPRTARQMEAAFRTALAKVKWGSRSQRESPRSRPPWMRSLHGRNRSIRPNLRPIAAT